MIDSLRDRGIRSVVVAGTDTHGSLLGKRIPLAELENVLRKGIAMCSVIWVEDPSASEMIPRPEGHAGYFPGLEDGFDDVILRADPETLRIIPWRDSTALLLGDHFAFDGAPLPISPRRILRSLVDRVRGHGYEPMAALEFEFYLLQDDPAGPAMRTAADLRPLSSRSRLFRITESPHGAGEKIFDELCAYGLEIEAFNPESGPGQFELNLRYTSAVEAADEAVLLRTGVKDLAEQNGLLASFMAKLHPQWPGSSCHIHLSLASDGENAFVGDAEEMSPLMKQAAAGILATMPDFTALFAPTVNSYRRLQPYSWGGTTASWGIDNRTVALRAICGGEGTRLEHRQGGADANPYLVAAAALAGALYGIENELTPPPMFAGDTYARSVDEAPPLPTSLSAAADALERSAVAREYFGSDFVDYFVALKRGELRSMAQAVTDWEIERYLRM